MLRFFGIGADGDDEFVKEGLGFLYHPQVAEGGGSKLPAHTARRGVVVVILGWEMGFVAFRIGEFADDVKNQKAV